jgi:glycosyltransferase involved in cell wall biosynthesis
MLPAPEPRHVLVVRPTLGHGGADHVTLTLLASLDRRRLKPSLALARGDRTLLPDLPSDVPLHDLGSRGLATVWRPLARLLRRLKPDVLFSTSSGGNLTTIVAAQRAGFRGRVVISERNGLVRDQPPTRRALLLLLKRALYRRADLVTAVSEGVRGDLIRRLHLDPVRVVTTYNPVVTSDLLAAAAAPLDEPWLAGSQPWLLAVGRLVPAKDFRTLVEAAALLRDRWQARMVILGEGPERPVLLDLARKLGLRGALRLPGYDKNPFRWMSRCTVFVLSSRFEGLPGVLIEAMACGAPVVATDCPFGPSEIVEHATTGMLVPVGHAPGLAQAIAELLSEPAKRARLAEWGRVAAARYSVNEVVPLYERALLGER